jgi:hypothetical protein
MQDMRAGHVSREKTYQWGHPIEHQPVGAVGGARGVRLCGEQAEKDQVSIRADETSRRDAIVAEVEASADGILTAEFTAARI